MFGQNITIRNIIAIFERESQDVLGMLDDLEEAIKNLQYEGKVSWGKNTKAIEKVVSFLRKKLLEHIQLDEDVIFPYAQKHIPKLESMIYFLRAERNEFKQNLENFELLFKQLRLEKNNQRQQKIIDQLKEKGIYVICLVRNHIQTEIESVYKSMDTQLHQDERKILVRKCLQFKLNPFRQKKS
ncbi:MAG: hemerythrin domain-containing protein [Candidatus Omnitrophota bacterium]